MTPSVPRCGRMDPHERHGYTVGARIINGRPMPSQEMVCLGHVVHEGCARCQHCGHVVCTCDAELAEERRAEWWSE